MQREHPSAEMVMLYRVFLTNERSLLADERKIAKGIYHGFFLWAVDGSKQSSLLSYNVCNFLSHE